MQTLNSPGKHDPTPDNKSGPWLRLSHRHDAEGILLPDPACGACQYEHDCGTINTQDFVKSYTERYK